jgi:MFS family permease
MIKEALEFEKEAISSSYSALWKDPSVRKRLLLAFVLNAGQQITGQGTLNTYSTIIYKKVFASDSTIALINALNATFAIFFTMNATWTVDRFGRKFLLIVGAIGMAICMVIVAAVVTETPGGNTKSEPVGIAVVFLLFLFALFYKPSWGATVWICKLSLKVEIPRLMLAPYTGSLRTCFFTKNRPGWHFVKWSFTDFSKDVVLLPQSLF